MSPLPRFPSDSFRVRLRAQLASAGYTESHIGEVAGPEALTRFDPTALPKLCRRVAGESAIEVLVRLFLLGQREEEPVVTQALDQLSTDEWLESGLLVREGARLASPVCLSCEGELLLLHDRPDRLASDSRADYVMGPSPSARTLAQVLVDRPARRTLDLGTGCGILALGATRFSERVLATDLSPRAVAFARLNAELNGADGIEVRQGDLFAPVDDLRFDRIISNPPFVLSPSNDFIYRDGDENLLRRLFLGAGAHLEEGGYCQVMLNWPVYADRDPIDAIRAWLEGTDLDGWLLRFATDPVDEYADRWIHHSEPSLGLQERARRYDEWMAYYQREKIESVGHGFLMTRWTGGRGGRISVTDAPPAAPVNAGEAIVGGFEARDFLRRTDDRALLRSHLVLSPDARLERQLTPAESGWKATTTVLRLASGLTHQVRLDPAFADRLVQLDGSRTVVSLLDALAREGGADRRRMRQAALPIVRRLVEHGFLIPPRRSGKPAGGKRSG